MMFRARLVCVCLMLGLSGCPQQTRLDGDADESEDDGRNPSSASLAERGEDGADGVDGANGVDGADGADGADGVDGADGSNGVDGADGANGADGVDGADGLSSLVRVIPADPSATCPAGGSVVEAGIDRDGDLLLGDDEVDSSALICNGSDGADAIAQEEVEEGPGCLLEAVESGLQVACPRGVELESEALTPKLATSSSFTGGWTAANAAWSDQAGWMSEIDSGNPEWLQYDFGAPVVLTKVHALAVSGRQGWAPMIQGSNDGESWTDLHALGAAASNARAPWAGYVRTDEDIETTSAFRYVRLHSEPGLFVYYAWLGFDGAIFE